MLIYSIILTFIAIIISLFSMPPQFMSFGTLIFLTITVAFGTMGTTSLVEIFRRNYRESLPDNNILKLAMDYGLNTSSIIFPILINVLISSGIGALSTFSMYLGKSNSFKIFLFQFIWVLISVIFGVIVTLVAYPLTDYRKVVEKVKEQKPHVDKLKSSINSAISKVKEKGNGSKSQDGSVNRDNKNQDSNENSVKTENKESTDGTVNAETVVNSVNTENVVNSENANHSDNDEKKSEDK